MRDGILKLVSTDFDGTIHEDFADAPIPEALERRLGAWPQQIAPGSSDAAVA